MQYKGQLCSLGPEIMKAALNRQTPTDVGEFIRKAFVYGMRNGENLCIDTDQSKPNFANYNSDGTFNADMFFNWAELNKEENYMTYVRESENHGIGGTNPGFGYCRSPDFGMIIRCGFSDESDVQEVIENIPNFNENFQ